VVHRNARTTVRVRREMVNAVRFGMPVAEVARRFGVSRPTVYKWLDRWRRGASLEDRSSRPRRMPRMTPQLIADWVIALREATGDGPAVIAGKLGMAWSTVWKILRRAGKSRLPRQPRPPVVRYERSRPGELVHVDVKKLPRIGAVPGHRVTGDRTNQHRKATSGSGYDYVFVAIDDRTRVSFAWIYDAENALNAVDFLHRAHAWYRANGIRIERVLTDNGVGFKNDWKAACGGLGIAPKYTRPYRPQTNGKAERLIRTMLAGWAYASVYLSNSERVSALAAWIDAYNTRRYHTGIRTTPWQRAQADLAAVNNVCEHYT
jgi:transposase InsO family protein